jgi:hypothetical protein
MNNDIEKRLNNFDATVRKNALKEVVDHFNTGKLKAAEASKLHNMHCHTIYSYNGYAFSPSYIAYLAKKEGWFAAGIVDFDVLDAVDEFLNACKMLNIRALCGVETRAYLNEFSDKVINSPGEPGIAYHMGIGFTSSKLPSPDTINFLKTMKERAATRTKVLVDKVNSFLKPVILDFEKDAAPLTPKGNVTERHVCEAYENKAIEIFPNKTDRAIFWSEKLGINIDEANQLINDSVALQGLIRSKTMKSGGVGYVKAGPESFPPVQEFNDFIIASGGIPTIAWLNGLTPGEQTAEKLVDHHITLGAAALNIIPDRNWNISNIEEKQQKLKELKRIIQICEDRDMPIIVGTEMNAPGLKLVDSFEAIELKDYVDIFVKGAAIMTAHTILEQEGKGYLSKWAANKFESKSEKNKYFENFGRNL